MWADQDRWNGQEVNQSLGCFMFVMILKLVKDDVYVQLYDSSNTNRSILAHTYQL